MHDYNIPYNPTVHISAWPLAFYLHFMWLYMFAGMYADNKSIYL